MAQPTEDLGLTEAKEFFAKTGKTVFDPVTLTSERKKQHGDWLRQAQKAHELKQVAHHSVNWDGLLAPGQSDTRLKPYQREAIDMILVKISRILTGDPSHDDHWDDIAGYAYLGKGGHK